jgi:SAM-dependent methyltransferase
VDAVELWDAAIAEWRLPESCVSAAGQASPHSDVAFSDRMTSEEIRADTPSLALAREALGHGGTVLDVGCGAGSASLALARRSAQARRCGATAVGRVVGVDARRDMLKAFAAHADRLGVQHTEIHGDWPGMSACAPVADIVVCHHVLYYVSALAPFVHALTAHAHRRVVLEIPEQHPTVRLRPLWQRFHGLDRPSGPNAGDAVRALRQLGLAVQIHPWTPDGPTRSGDADFAAHICSTLCLPPDRQAEVREMLLALDLGRTLPMATLWWPAPHRASAT